MQFTESVLNAPEFTLNAKNRSPRIYANLRRELSGSVIDAEDVSQEFYAAALRVLRLGKVHDSFAHFLNEVTAAVYNYLKSEASRGSVSPTGIHTVDLRRGASPSDSRRISRGNIAETLQATPLSLDMPMGHDGLSNASTLESILSSEKIVHHYADPVSEEEMLAFWEMCPTTFEVLVRSNITAKGREGLPAKIAEELLNYVESHQSPDAWYEELLEMGRDEVYAAAFSRFETIRAEYIARRDTGFSRPVILDELMSESRRPLYEFMSLVFLTCVTGRGERGPYQKRNREAVEMLEGAE